MLIWILFALMTAALLAAVLRPLLAPLGAAGHVMSSADVYRAQLAELEVEKSAGRLGEPEYQAARAEIGRRLLKASAAPEVQAAVAPAKRMPIVAIVVTIAVPAVALSLYLTVGSPNYPDQPLASRGAELQRAREFGSLTSQLEAKLRAGKGDVTGWIMFGRIKSESGDFAAAVDAYSHAAALLTAANQPIPADLLVAIGESEVGQAQGQVTPRAQDSFRAALALDSKQPSARYYLALAKMNAGDTKAALADFKALLADAPADAQWRSLVETRIQQLTDKPR
jgi:cytochrome c-type biogenesis protein CcmH